ncbi:hypothetical protein QTA58_22810 [Neorhizobium sp. CSC1952]|uniref:hypothetical protein n=1 Tax=Neorhizobium sp. CSC1952 TaxID=2978974 RepID=UPI0025A5DD11|nr:hypothetical protein [Rhizobium sp. CSC1952]WJR66985.1 hypothetical protein QTA58_22810 [Rhizobium sp. CSC1952]
MSILVTHDGTCIIVDPELGPVSGRNREEAEAEIRRRKALRQRSDGGLNIIHRHVEIQTGRVA